MQITNFLNYYLPVLLVVLLIEILGFLLRDTTAQNTTTTNPRMSTNTSNATTFMPNGTVYRNVTNNWITTTANNLSNITTTSNGANGTNGSSSTSSNNTHTGVQITSCYEDTAMNISDKCNLASDVRLSDSISKVINERCREGLLKKDSFKRDNGQIKLDGSVCGVLDAETIGSANKSQFCFSSKNVSFHILNITMTLDSNLSSSDILKQQLLQQFNNDMLKKVGFADLGFIDWNKNSNTLEVSMIVRFSQTTIADSTIYGNLTLRPTIKSLEVLKHCLDEDTTTTTTSLFTTKDPKIDIVSPTSKSKKPCQFISKYMPFDVRTAINKRCRSLISFQIESFVGKNKISINNKRCGVENSTNATYAMSSPICYSYIDNQLKRTIVHVLRIEEELYIPDFGNFRKAAFRKMKKKVENTYNEVSLNSSQLVGFGFDRAILLSIDLPTSPTRSLRRKRTPKVGLDVSLAIQLSKANVDLNEYERYFNRETKGGTVLGDNKLDTSVNHIKYAESCNESLKSVFKEVEAEVLTASGIDLEEVSVTPIGSSIDLVCPRGTKFSFDNDGFVVNDGIFQVVCNTHQKYSVPLPSWPKCVQFCPLILPNPPEHTGLVNVKSEFTTPSGQNARYMCKNSDLGVDQGSSIYYEVECLNNTKYKVPTSKYDWPICEVRTTTMRPEISIGVNNMLNRYKWNINYHYTLYQRGSDFIPKELKDYFSTVTIPCFIGLLVVILFCLCFTRNDSPICLICKDSTLRKKKTLIPLKNFENN
nr:uncharacterized protein LOC121124805 [Lepeophtheirus salmonis]